MDRGVRGGGEKGDLVIDKWTSQSILCFPHGNKMDQLLFELVSSWVCLSQKGLTVDSQWTQGASSVHLSSLRLSYSVFAVCYKLCKTKFIVCKSRTRSMRIE